MVYDGVLKGEYVALHPVSEEDAEFTLMVRQDERLTRYLPKVNNTLEQQKEWIAKQREKAGDYFFVAKDCYNKPVGTIGIYDIHGDAGEGGRITCIGNALQSFEIQYLIFRFIFDTLKLEKVTSYVYAANTSALKLSAKFGVRFDKPVDNGEGQMICNGCITKDQFNDAAPGIERMLYRKKKD